MSEPARPGELTEGWAMRQLTGFLTIFSNFDEEGAATATLVQRAADVLEADGAALIGGGQILASGGPATGHVSFAALRAVSAGRRDRVELPAGGEAHAFAVPVGEAEGHALVLLRSRAAFAPQEVELVQALARVVALGKRTYGLLEEERALRTETEAQAGENARLLDALRARQVLLERLSRVQRAIVSQNPLHTIYEQVVEAAIELVGDELAILRLRDVDGSAQSVVVAAEGMSEELVSAGHRGEDPGIGNRAMLEGRLVVVDKATDPMVRDISGQWRREGVYAGMAAPILRGGNVMGSICVATTDPNRSYTPRDQQALLALAEHTSLALNHARALDDAAHQAFHDSLTGMPNRVLFLDRLANAASRANRTGDPVGVLFVDIDDFKTINDSLGHRAGDELLKAVAARLQSCLRPADTIARLGGDEFAVLLEEISDTGDAATAAGRMLESLNDPVAVSGREIYVSASIGIAAGDADTENLLRDADLAMYRAKAEGKGRYRAYAPHMHADIVDRLELDVDLKRAIEQDELELHYQPIFGLDGGAIVGMEALVRWNHPTRGFMSPGHFIPLAEASGRIHDLGRWALHTACHQAALWRARYPSAQINVGVNLSGAQLQDAEIVDHVADALRKARLEPEGLTLEITETALMEDLEGAIERLGQLKALGIDIAVDDFGVGHSSLVYLKKLPLDNLKIAQPFVEEIGQPDLEPPILRAILELADVFGLAAVAEGIERPEQADVLRGLGCELGQGYHLSRPLPVDQAEELILRMGLMEGSSAESSAPPAATPEALSPTESVDDQAAAS